MSDDNPTMQTRDIMARIPHRHPMVFIDRVITLEDGVRGVGVKCITYNEAFFPGHFPEMPIFPGALIMEAMAQMAAIVLGGTGETGTSSEQSILKSATGPRFLAKVDRLKFVRPVVPGDRLEIEVVVKKRFAGLVLVEAVAFVEGEIVASGELSLAG